MNEGRKNRAEQNAASQAEAEAKSQDLPPEMIAAVVREREAAKNTVEVAAALEAEGLELSPEAVAELTEAAETLERAEDSARKAAKDGRGHRIGRYSTVEAERMTTDQVMSLARRAAGFTARMIARRAPRLSDWERAELEGAMRETIASRGVGTDDLARRWLKAPYGTEQSDRRLWLLERDVERAERLGPPWRAVAPLPGETARAAWNRYLVAGTGRSYARDRARGYFQRPETRAELAARSASDALTRAERAASAVDNLVGDFNKAERAAIMSALGTTARDRARLTGSSLKAEERAATRGRPILAARWATPAEAADALLPPEDKPDGWDEAARHLSRRERLLAQPDKDAGMRAILRPEPRTETETECPVTLLTELPEREQTERYRPGHPVAELEPTHHEGRAMSDDEADALWIKVHDRAALLVPDKLLDEQGEAFAVDME